jgi:hypothetical protein
MFHTPLHLTMDVGAGRHGPGLRRLAADMPDGLRQAGAEIG